MNPPYAFTRRESETATLRATMQVYLEELGV